MHFKHLDYPSALPSVRKCGVSWILHMLLYNVFMIMLIHTSSFLSQVSSKSPLTNLNRHCFLQKNRNGRDVKNKQSAEDL